MCLFEGFERGRSFSEDLLGLILFYRWLLIREKDCGKFISDLLFPGRFVILAHSDLALWLHFDAYNAVLCGLLRRQILSGAPEEF